jgi:radical SAM superfamily enzyme YgiQ (UPF0313 family)
MRVLLIYPDFAEETKHVKNIPGNYSEGLASISAVLKAAGHDVALYHLTYMPGKAEFLERVRKESPGLAGFTVRTTAMPFVSELTGWLAGAMPELPVVCGGYHPTLVPEEVLALRGVSAVCVGEGEYPLRELADSLAAGQARTDIQSLWFKLPGGVVKNPVRPLIEDLDELPFPDLDLFDFANLRTGRIKTAMVMVSRGCLFSCTYCGNSQFRNVYPNKSKYARFRSPANAIKLIKRIIHKQPDVKYLEFRDAIFNMYPEWFYPFMELYKQEIALPFNCNLRFDLLDEKMAHTLAGAGCYLIDIGLESGDEEYRAKYLHRHMTDEHMVNASRWLRAAGITTCTYNILGLPHETPALALKTIRLNARMDVDRVIANIFYPYPQTKLREIAEQAGFIDPRVDPNDKVQLRQPGFSRGDVLYFSYKFHKLMRKYRKLFALPPGKAERAAAALDKRLLGPLRPRWLLWRMAAAKESLTRRAKRAASKLSPSVYLSLRNRRIRALAKEEKGT